MQLNHSNHDDVLNNKISNTQSSVNNNWRTNFDVVKNEISNINQSNLSNSDILNNKISNNSVSIVSNTDILNINVSNSIFNPIYYYNVSDSINLSNYSYLSNQSIYINDVYNTSIFYSTVTPVNTIDTEDIDTNVSAIFHDSLPLFFRQDYLIKVPRVERYIRRNIPNSIMLTIHSDYETAVELCLLYISQLTSTYFDIKENPTSTGWKQLKAEYLREIIGGDATMYKRIREVLEYVHPIHGSILECDHKHVAGVKSFGHRINREVLVKGIVAYKLKSTPVQQQWYHNQMLSYARAMLNPIAKNLILMYPHLELPTIEEIHVEAKRLVKNGFRTKKHKILKYRNKHADSYFKDLASISFVEDAVEIYDYLVLKNGLMIPMPSEDAGGRVFDSLNLMPSWIRNLVKYKGHPLVELDYQCLHPNLACTLYGGTSEYLRHQNLADELNIDVLEVKTQHLSFFNKNVPQMKQSPIYEYYQQKEPRMIQNIINDKIFNTEYKYKSEKHKITSKRMFKLEVDIMTSVIQKLTDKGIHVLYVFDAVYGHSNDVSVIVDIMNKSALENDVKTTVKR